MVRVQYLHQKSVSPFICDIHEVVRHLFALFTSLKAKTRSSTSCSFGRGIIGFLSSMKTERSSYSATTDMSHIRTWKSFVAEQELNQSMSRANTQTALSTPQSGWRDHPLWCIQVYERRETIMLHTPSSETDVEGQEYYDRNGNNHERHTPRRDNK